MFVKDACQSVDSPGERGDCPDLRCGNPAVRGYFPGGKHLEGVVDLGDSVVGFLFWQSHLVLFLSGGLTSGAQTAMTP
jgi:hypothetical protein